MRRAGLWALLSGVGLMALAAPLAAQAQVVILVAGDDPASQAVARDVRGALLPQVDSRWLEFTGGELGDPIAKGRLVASLQASRLVVSVGDSATRVALSEVEDTPVYFISSSAPGKALGRAGVSGLLTYSAGDVLAAGPASWKRGLGLLYTPGYRTIAERIHAEARQAGVSLLARSVSAERDIPSGGRELLGSAKAVWVLGDPLLSEGAGFTFLVEQSLARDVPLIGAGPAQVAAGAAFCSQAPARTLATAAAAAIDAQLRGEAGEVRLAPSTGRIIFDPALRARFGLRPTASWEALP